MSEKLQKVLAARGLGSRRELETWISAGRVQVNGRIATLGARVEPTDKISVDGRPLRVQEEKPRRRVLVYNKPEGEVCTRSDEAGRQTVFSRLPPLPGGRWIIVGRLDINTTGLLLFTNDGELANALMHPSSEVEREYLVRVFGTVDDDMIKRLIAGVELDDGLAAFKSIKAGEASGSNRWFSVVLTEGRNREVRRLWESQGVEVSRLKRIRYANVALPSWVRRGEWVELEPGDTNRLARLVALKGEKRISLTPQERARHQRQVKRLRSRGHKN